MKNFPDWDGQPYYPIGRFYKNRFGEKVYKITVSAAQTCPNRARNDGVGCIFCDELGSAGSHLIKHMPLERQIAVNRERLRHRFKVKKFLVYFQPFTNTYKRLEQFQRDIELALDQDKVVGIVFGTRPDCLPDDLFPYLQNLTRTSYVSVELGVQCFSDDQLEFLNRGHTVQDSLDAIENLHSRSGVFTGIHLIFGIPGETDDLIRQTALRINQLPIHNVKLHHLHVLAKTGLEKRYNNGDFIPLTLEEYARRVGLFLSYLSPEIAVQRLAAVAPRWDELIAPQWTRERLKPTQFIIKSMLEQSLHQGIRLNDQGDF